MPEEPNSGTKISDKECGEFIQKFADKVQPGQVKSCFFGINTIAKILGQDSCKGIRINMAINKEGNESFVIFGVDLEGKDLNAAEHIIVEYGVAKHAQ
jgi:hypothetical protein